MTEAHDPPPAGGHSSTGIAFDDEGVGQPLVLVHAGVADRRMWAPIVPALAAGHRVIRADARGFGESMPPTGPWAHHTDLLAVLDELLVTQAHLVGASMGAGIAVEAALARPALAASLVLVAPGGPLLGNSPESLRPIWAAEVDALDRGDLDAAVEVNLRAWVDGPDRPPDAVDPDVRAFVGRMQREAFELPEWDPEVAPEHELSPPAIRRLGELRMPILVVVGDRDQPAVREAAERVASSARDARLVVWPGVAHLPSLERPEEFTELLLGFLADAAARPAVGARRVPRARGAARRRRSGGRGRTLRWVALGDSYTIGTATRDGRERWPNQVVDGIAAAGGGLELVANLAVNGYTSGDVIELELPALDAYRPDVVSVLAGVNDVVQGVPPERYAANIAALLDDLLRRLPPERILAVSTPDYTVTPQGENYGDPARQAAVILRNNDILAQLAVERGIPFVDIYDLSLLAADDRSLVADDGLHPSGSQYALWVERIGPVMAAIVRRALGDGAG